MCTCTPLRGVREGELQSLVFGGARSGFPGWGGVLVQVGEKDFSSAFLGELDCGCCVFLLVGSGIFG